MAKKKLPGRLEKLGAHAAKTELASAEAKIQHLEDALEKARTARRPQKIPAAGRRRRLKGDKVRMLFGDLHGSYQDPTAVARVLADVKSMQPDEIILGGDMVDCGGFLAQHHTLSYLPQLEYTYEEDLAAAGAFLDALSAAAPKASIEYIEGNHESRVEKFAIKQALSNRTDSNWLVRQLAPQYQLKLKERGIPYYRSSEHYDGLTVPGWIKRGKIYITHAISTAKHAAAQAISKTAGNVIYFHSHRADTYTTNLVNSGVVSAWNPGCLCKRQQLYMHTNPSGWAHGYALQFVAGSGNFLHLQVPILDGESLLPDLLKR